jgi:hypothetical protein
MIVALSVILAAVLGGVVFMLLDVWQRREAAPLQPEPAWRPPTPHEPRTEPLPRRSEPEEPPRNLWSGWARD